MGVCDVVDPRARGCGICEKNAPENDAESGPRDPISENVCRLLSRAESGIVGGENELAELGSVSR